MKGKPDQIDLWCWDWARERRKVFGINLMLLEPRERIGKLNCTLGRLQDDKVGAGDGIKKVNQYGYVEQNWPEVYVGVALDIHRGFGGMRYEWRGVMDAQYVWPRVPVREKLQALGIKNMEYWSRLSMLKVYLSGFLGLDLNFVQTKNSAVNVGKVLLSAG